MAVNCLTWQRAFLKDPFYQGIARVEAIDGVKPVGHVVSCVGADAGSYESDVVGSGVGLGIVEDDVLVVVRVTEELRHDGALEPEKSTTNEDLKTLTLTTYP